MQESKTFHNLQVLDLSFNNLSVSGINNLMFIPNLRQLNLEKNELTALPENLGGFYNLEELNLRDNKFTSDKNASTLWGALATIPKLKVLNISYNKLRGIHTEKLVAGNFKVLEVLDISFNAVEHQHNLICARNFHSLKLLVITGNPFAIK